MRRRVVVLGWAAALLAAVSAVRPVPPLLLWNASASVPIGLWRVAPRVAPSIDEVAVVRLTGPARRLAAARGYLPAGVRLIKPVVAVAGDLVCADGREIAINARRVADRLAQDARGRAMPWWSGCRLLGEGDLFVLAETHADAFDGRYFGVTGAADVVGRATPLWLR